MNLYVSSSNLVPQLAQNRESSFIAKPHLVHTFIIVDGGELSLIAHVVQDSCTGELGFPQNLQ